MDVEKGPFPCQLRYLLFSVGTSSDIPVKYSVGSSSCLPVTLIFATQHYPCMTRDIKLHQAAPLDGYKQICDTSSFFLPHFPNSRAVSGLRKHRAINK